MLKKKKKKSLFSIDSVEVINDLVVFAVSCFFVSKNNKKVASVAFGKCCLALAAGAKCRWQSSRERSLKGKKNSLNPKRNKKLFIERKEKKKKKTKKPPS